MTLAFYLLITGANDENRATLTTMASKYLVNEIFESKRQVILASNEFLSKFWSKIP